MSGSSAKRRPASHRAAVSRERYRLPGWAWLVLGAAIAVFVMAILHLAQPRHDLHSQLIPSSAPPPTTGHAQSGPVPLPPKQPASYSFYQTLPKRQPVVPVPAPAPTPAPVARPATPPQVAEKPAPQPPAASANRGAVSHPTIPASSGDWQIQVGAYRSEGEANRVRARVDLLGSVAHLEAVAIRGQVWYRVRIGPVAGQAKAQALSQRLKTNGIPALVIRPKG
ncbi:MAG TPA: SPOR domain-containing protein [Nevskiaceae bacterium]|nr:SPOR domain-containing protein [Nevskiaceae bacterium]